MSEVKIIQVTTEKQLSDFIKFPMNLYKNNQNYVPSLIKDEKSIWNKEENPALAYSEAKQFLAYKDDEIVGRIAVMINHKEAQELGIEKVRFGWLDFIDDEAVSKALGTGFVSFAFTDIEILRASGGKPYVLLHNKAKVALTELGGFNINISISHSKHYAHAVAIID